jgi:hypothetical protein
MAAELTAAGDISGDISIATTGKRRRTDESG